jgi:hypothetical protein
MSIQTTLTLNLDVEFFQLEEAAQAEMRARDTGGRVYCWKTTGDENWLEAGFSVTDVYGIVVLPHGLPDTLEMPDDEKEAEEA